MPRIKTVLMVCVILSLLASGEAFAQQSGQPVMKVTIRDGVVVKTEPVSQASAQSNAVRIQDRRDSSGDAVRTVTQQDPQRDQVVIPQTGPGNQAVRKSKIPPVFFPTIPPQQRTAGTGIKGRTEPSVTIPDQLIFDRGLMAPRAPEPKESEKPAPPSGSQSPRAPEAWVNIMTETFEGAFPTGLWNTYASSGYTNAYWNDVSTRPHTGSWSGWCAGGGTTPGTGGVYQPNMRSWAIYGPFNLSDAVDAHLQFYLWLNSETNFDYFGYYASTNGTNFYGYSTSGSTGGWVFRDFDLTAVPGLGDLTADPQVWIAFYFTSDGSVQYEGAYVDDVILQKDVLSNLPDLQPVSIVLTTDQWTSGLSVTADLTERNSGTAAAGSHVSQLYLSNDNLLDASDLLLGTPISFGTIAAGAQATGSRTFTAPSKPGGTYYMIVKVDVNNSVPELNEANNTAWRSGLITYPGGMPDLTSVSIVLTASTWTSGLSVTADLTEQNIGSAAAGAHQSQLYLSSDNVLDGSDLLLGSPISFGTIAAGAQATLSRTFTAPSKSCGSYYMIVKVDINNSVVESNEGNNIGVRAGLITYTGCQPDLVATMIVLTTDQWTSGLSVTATLTEQNIGDAAAGSHQSQLYLSNDNVLDGSDVSLGAPIAFGTIAAGAQATASRTFAAPSKPNGDYYMIVSVDINNSVVESNEANNIAWRSGLIHYLGAPDLVAYTIVLTTDQWTPGLSVTADLTERNAGTVTAGSHQSQLYLSNDNVLDGSDVTLGAPIAFGSIAAGAQATASRTFAAPSKPPGNYYMIVSVDINNSVAESNEANNIAYRSGLITYPTTVLCRDVIVATGWNILSVPVLAANMSPTSLFPGAASSFYGYNNGYVVTNPLLTGRGYWAKFNAGATFNICGDPITPRDVPVLAGWNIIGPYDMDAAAASVTSTPAGIVLTPFYGYSNGYVTATTLSVGKGYWVKVSQAGTLHLQPNTITPPATASLPEISLSWGRLEITDNAGHTGVLYLTTDGTDPSPAYELPPSPPSGIFDVRFCTNRAVSSIGTAAQEVLLSAAVPPLQIRATNLNGRSLALRDGLGGTIVRGIIQDGGVLTIRANMSSFFLATPAAEDNTPSVYSLGQNYPNPFNPTTMISFGVPVPSAVRITLFSILGEEVAEITNRTYAAGHHQITLDARDLSSGTYLYKMESGNFVAVKKLLLLK